ncbi:MAG: hypothetical protein JWM95_3006 [Gemmatimonadetes bacterium]|nr:hypothetical protein [Gemmatimonadota bacterium]
MHTTATLVFAAVMSLDWNTGAAAHDAQNTWCTPGARLDVYWNSGWYAATAKANTPTGCLVGYDGYGARWDERVGADRAGARGSRRAFAAGRAGTPATRPAAPAVAGAPGAPTPGRYHCVFYSQGSGLQTLPGFAIKGSSYTHDNGGGGTIRYDSATGVLDFVGGPLDKQAGTVKPKEVHLYNERRSRTVMDCDTQGS